MIAPGEEAILLALDGLVREPSAWQAIEAMVKELRGELARQPQAAFARREIPLELLGGGHPAEIRSCNIYVLRPRAVSGVERHANSHQRSLAVAGCGEFQTRRDGAWETHPLRSEPAAPPERRWASIPPGTWHQAVVGADEWVVVTFHTEADSRIQVENMLS